MMEGSRYHAYSNPSAKPFLIYDLAKHVSLKDESGVNSAKFRAAKRARAASTPSTSRAALQSDLRRLLCLSRSRQSVAQHELCANCSSMGS